MNLTLLLCIYLLIQTLGEEILFRFTLQQRLNKIMRPFLHLKLIYELLEKSEAKNRKRRQTHFITKMDRMIKSRYSFLGGDWLFIRQCIRPF